MITILFLAADSSSTTYLHLRRELQDIRKKLQLSKNIQKLTFESRKCIHTGDITQTIFDVNPQIIHFSGHRIQNGELCFEDMQGKIQPVTPAGLAALFRLVSKQVSCVVLNTSYSKIQAQAISEHISYIIGINQEIEDNAAVTFFVGFYKALAANHSISEAYQFGCTELFLQGIQENLAPTLYIYTKETIHHRK